MYYIHINAVLTSVRHQPYGSAYPQSVYLLPSEVRQSLMPHHYPTINVFVMS